MAVGSALAAAVACSTPTSRPTGTDPEPTPIDTVIQATPVMPPAAATVPRAIASVASPTASLPVGASAQTISNYPTPAGPRIILIGSSFQPGRIVVAIGQTVAWINEDHADHNIVDDRGLLSSPTLGWSASYSYTFVETGIYRYICAFHPGMVGEILVE
jgi:plastocyanin